MKPIQVYLTVYLLVLLSSIDARIRNHLNVTELIVSKIDDNE